MLMWKIMRVSEVSILFKYCTDMENCESLRSFGFIYIYIYMYVCVLLKTL